MATTSEKSTKVDADIDDLDKASVKFYEKYGRLPNRKEIVKQALVFFQDNFSKVAESQIKRKQSA